MAEAILAASGEHNGLWWTIIGTGVVLMLIGLLFLLRRFLHVLTTATIVAISAALLICAVFGEPLGIYPAIHAWWSGSDVEEADADGQENGPGVPEGGPPSPETRS